MELDGTGGGVVIAKICNRFVGNSLGRFAEPAIAGKACRHVLVVGDKKNACARASSRNALRQMVTGTPKSPRAAPARSVMRCGM